VIAATGLVDYDGNERTLEVLFVGTGVRVSVLEGAGGTVLVSPTAHGVSGGFALEARNSEAGLPVQAVFDDFTWQVTAKANQTRAYTYNDVNQLMAISGAESSAYDYDDVGRLSTRTKDGVPTVYAYDRLDRLTRMSVNGVNSDYTYYGPTWMRKSSVTGQCGALKTYLYDGHTCVSETVNGVSKTYAVPGGEALWEQAGGTNLVYAKDGCGNVTGLWGGGESGYAVGYDYDAFGNVSSRVPAGDSFAKVTNTSGPRYRGELYDSETEQVFLRNRFYDPGVGRFLSMDPKGNVDGPNLYAYCGGDPVNRADPMGMNWVWNAAINDYEWVNDFGWGRPLSHAFLDYAFRPAKPSAPSGAGSPSGVMSSGGAVTGIGPGGMGLGLVTVNGPANDLNPNEVLAEVGRQGEAGIRRFKVSAALGANIGAPILLIPAGLGMVDAGLHGGDVTDAYANSTLVSAALLPATFVQSGRVILTIGGTGLGTVGAYNSFSEGNYAGGVFRAGTTAFGAWAGSKDVRVFAAENPRLNPLNYVEFQGQPGTTLNMGGLGGVKFGYNGPRQSGLSVIDRPGMAVELIKDAEGNSVPVYGQSASSSTTPGHGSTILAVARALAASGEYEYVVMQRSWRTATGRVGTSRSIPDVIGVRRDGTVNAWEVMSAADKEASLFNRLLSGRDTLPASNQGAIQVIPPK